MHTVIARARSITSAVWSSAFRGWNVPMLLLLAGLLLGASAARAGVLYNGNGHTDFGGPIGTGSLTLSDDGATVYGIVTLGSGQFNDCLVIYIQTGAGGFASTAGFTDYGDGSRRRHFGHQRRARAAERGDV